MGYAWAMFSRYNFWDMSGTYAPILIQIYLQKIYMPGISEKSVWGTANFDQAITFNNNLLTAHTTISETSIEFINLKSDHRF